MFQRIISRFPGRTRIAGQPQRLYGLNCHSSVKLSDQSPKPLSQITQKRDLFSGTSHVVPDTMPKYLGNLGTKLGFTQANSIHSTSRNEFERDLNNGPTDPNRRFDDINGRQQQQQSPVDTLRNSTHFQDLSRRFTDADRNRPSTETTGRDTRPFWRDIGTAESTRNMNFVRGILRDNNQRNGDSSQNYRSGVEQNADIVHVKILRNNTFVTVTDSKGNKKMGASAGCLAEMKGGPKVSKYSAEATAEHVGRVAKSMGLKSVVMKVNGFTFFKRKKLAILSFRDGYTHSRSDKNPIVYIEDTTRKPHNGCRLRKQRRV